MREKRLFFGLQVQAPWPRSFPKGKVLAKEMRHFTLAFLGKVEKIEPEEIPPPIFTMAPTGQFLKCLILRRVVAWEGSWFGKDMVTPYRDNLLAWLKIDPSSPFLPHVTLARNPEELEKWKEEFTPLPFICPALHLYESLGNSQYRPVWSHKFTLPFEEKEHTADAAFTIRGEKFDDLFLHATVALSFCEPSITAQVAPRPLSSLDEVIIALNEWIAETDITIGSPYKAVSYHSALQQEKNLLTWEMIVDV